MPAGWQDLLDQRPARGWATSSVAPGQRLGQERHEQAVDLDLGDPVV
jgi:hypothetical protein